MEHYQIVKIGSRHTDRQMGHQTIAPPSSLPSLMMPCPVCAGRMVYKNCRPITAEVEDTVYACRQCGTELIRSTVCQSAPGRTGNARAA